LSAAEATAMDPQLRMLLEVTYECLESCQFCVRDFCSDSISNHC
jgi:acyl transferase domain-containing protein